MDKSDAFVTYSEKDSEWSKKYQDSLDAIKPQFDVSWMKPKDIATLIKLEEHGNISKDQLLSLVVSLEQSGIVKEEWEYEMGESAYAKFRGLLQEAFQKIEQAEIRATWLPELQKVCRNVGSILSLFHDETGEIISGIITFPGSAFQHVTDTKPLSPRRMYRRDPEEENRYLYASIGNLTHIVSRLFGEEIKATKSELSFLTLDEDVIFIVQNNWGGSPFVASKVWLEREDGKPIKSAPASIMQGEKDGWKTKEDLVRITKEVFDLR